MQQGFTVFADEKDSLLSLTPLYLMCGLSFPLWMPSSNLPLLVLLSGVLTVGIGDTAASFVGGKWGSHKWHDTEKTVEGTVACILCQICIILGLTFSGRFHLRNIFFLCFYQELYLFSRISSGFVDDYWSLLRSVLAVVAISVIEGRTNQVDNLALPLLMYVCQMI